MQRTPSSGTSAAARAGSRGNVVNGRPRPASYTAARRGPPTAAYNARTGAARRGPITEERHSHDTIGFRQRALPGRTVGGHHEASRSAATSCTSSSRKLMYDFHAARVLPGSTRTSSCACCRSSATTWKCWSASTRATSSVARCGRFRIAYDSDALKLIDDLRNWNIQVSAVVITRYDEQPARAQCSRTSWSARASASNARVHHGYPTDIDTISAAAVRRQHVHFHHQAPGGVTRQARQREARHVLVAALPRASRGRTVGYAKFETSHLELPLKHR